MCNININWSFRDQLCPHTVDRQLAIEQSLSVGYAIVLCNLLSFLNYADIHLSLVASCVTIATIDNFMHAIGPAQYSYSIQCTAIINDSYVLLYVTTTTAGSDINSIPVSVWLPQHVPRLHAAWGSSHRWAEIFFCVQVI